MGLGCSPAGGPPSAGQHAIAVAHRTRLHPVMAVVHGHVSQEKGRATSQPPSCWPSTPLRKSRDWWPAPSPSTAMVAAHQWFHSPIPSSFSSNSSFSFSRRSPALPSWADAGWELCSKSHKPAPQHLAGQLFQQESRRTQAVGGSSNSAGNNCPGGIDGPPAQPHHPSNSNPLARFHLIRQWAYPPQQRPHSYISPLSTCTKQSNPLLHGGFAWAIANLVTVERIKKDATPLVVESPLLVKGGW